MIMDLQTRKPITFIPLGPFLQLASLHPMPLVIRVPFHPVQWLSIEARLFATDVVISLCLLML